MNGFHVPSRDELSPDNQVIFDAIKKGVGKVPNLMATIGLSTNALTAYFHHSTAKSSLSSKEKEIINQVVSQINGCEYCISAHTFVLKAKGFSDEQIMEIRNGSATFDKKYDALVKYVKYAVEHRSKASPEVINAFYEANYTVENLIDVMSIISDQMFTNFLYGAAEIPIDFPLAPGVVVKQAD